LDIVLPICANATFASGTVGRVCAGLTETVAFKAVAIGLKEVVLADAAVVVEVGVGFA
jgi:hypothetical protein